jgi:hypothetical protein
LIRLKKYYYPVNLMVSVLLNPDLKVENLKAYRYGKTLTSSLVKYG